MNSVFYSAVSTLLWNWVIVKRKDCKNKWRENLTYNYFLSADYTDLSSVKSCNSSHLQDILKNCHWTTFQLSIIYCSETSNITSIYLLQLAENMIVLQKEVLHYFECLHDYVYCQAICLLHIFLYRFPFIS